ncbi:MULTISPECIES: hypothetical protein [unclassified Lysinibacillus]|uniref:hypothetical protein n=1 Tax=unclassified Lysinibacillus TaxID=2636778 RepID=UPI0025560872|nr:MULTISPECIES: hypothetical protein [unclassified Lysinibacillus]MDM5249091.1 hypothetical protein [Lysinibacillus sp. G4S2]
MNKKFLFSVAAIPAVIVAPAVVGAEEGLTIKISADAKVNDVITADVKNLPPNTYVNSYQWYYIEADGSEKLIPSATGISLKVPVEAENKTIIVKAITSNKTYESNKCTIKPLNLSIGEPIFEGYSSTNYVTPGDTVKVVADVIDVNGVKLQSNQITYSYQWFYKVGEVFSIINGATGATYTIPTDALDKEPKDIMVKVTAKVGTRTLESPPSKVLTVSKEPTETLTKNINNLLKDGNKYNLTTFGEFQALAKDLDKKYQSLSSAAKANVTNYDVLKRALADIAAINALNGKLDKLKDKGVSEKDLPQFLKNLEADYNKLDYLQRSLDVNDELYNAIKVALHNPSNINELTEVREINKQIMALLSYENSYIKYVPSSLESLQAEVNKIETRMSKLSKDYKAIVQNQTILQEAKQDIKKIEQFLKSFDKLLPNDTPGKQVTAAKSIRSTYEKLTYKQMLLVPNMYKEKLQNAENAEQIQIVKLNALIQSYLGSKQYPINPTKETWKEIVDNVNKIISDYKNLTKTSAAQIIDYDRIVTLQKDLKTAEKVIKDIDAYLNLKKTSGVSESKLKSSYSSTLKAYNKLTSLQQSLVYNAKEFLNNSPDVTVGSDGKVPDDKAKAEALKKQIDSFANITNFTLEQLEKEVESATATYKKLSSAARKYVTNYDLLTAASKDISGTKSFLKKVQDAKEERDVTKQVKKIQTVQTAYAKLPANQQHLAKPEYEKLLKLLDGNVPDVSKLDNEIAGIVNNDLYTVSIDKIKELSTQYNKLSSSDKKRVTNASILTTAVSDVKKVESFMKQYDKSFEKNPATVIKAFSKLTSKQTSLINENVRKKIIEAEAKQQSAHESALNLVEMINGLEQNGEYIANLETEVTKIRISYDKLSSTEKKVVKNYSKLTQAESDLKKVTEVYELYKTYEAASEDKKAAAYKTWQTAYGKLSKKLELLYKQMHP